VRTLHARFLLALVIIGVLPLAIVGLGVAALDRAALVEQSSRELTGLARGLAAELDVHLEDLWSINRGIAALPEIVSMDPARQRSLLRDLYLQYPAFGELAVYDTSGRETASSHARGAQSLAGFEALEDAVEGGREAWQVGPGPDQARSSLLLAAPIRDPTRAVVGAVVAVVDLASLATAIERVPIGAGGQAFVLDAAGRVLLHPDRALVQARPDYSWLGVPLGSRPVGPGTVGYELEREARVAGYAPVASVGWMVVVERPRAVVLGPAERSWQLALAGLAASAALAILAAIWLARTLTRPVRELATAARALGAGDPAAPLPQLPAIRDDVGALVEAFATMREAVAAREAESAQLLLREQAARAEAQAAESRFAFLAEASTLLAASLDYETTLAGVARLAVPYLADWCHVVIREEDGTTHTLDVAHADPTLAATARERQERYPPAIPTPYGVSKVLRTGQPEFYPQVTDAVVRGIARSDEHLLALQALGICSLMIVPLRARERTLGALIFIAAESRRHYTPEDLVLAEDLARRCALAVDNARLYREAQTAIRARDEFLSIASHELRTPLTGIKGFAQVLLSAQARGQLAPDRLERSLQRIDEACNRLGELVNDLLDVSRIRTGQLRLRPRELNLAMLVREVAGRYADQLANQHALAIELALDPCPVLVDIQRFEQILVNLLDNATKYSPDGGEVRVALNAGEGGALLRVSDRGIGLPPGTAEAIFEPFGRAPNAAQRHIPGMGLGLYICREIAELHGGRIWAESAGEDQGTTFALWLPFADSPLAPTPGPAESPPGAVAPAPGRGERD
jgi:signal transduction histidine kinase